jgi:hypothetical protein
MTRQDSDEGRVTHQKYDANTMKRDGGTVLNEGDEWRAREDIEMKKGCGCIIM